jgi:hypothetical protein
MEKLHEYRAAMFVDSLGYFSKNRHAGIILEMSGSDWNGNAPGIFDGDVPIYNQARASPGDGFKKCPVSSFDIFRSAASFYDAVFGSDASYPARFQQFFELHAIHSLWRCPVTLSLVEMLVVRSL